MYDGGSGMIFGMLWMILVWGVPLLLIAALLKYLFTRRHGNESKKSVPDELIEPQIPLAPEPGPPPVADERTPIEILKSAYARGELSRGEFLQKRDDILEK
jgi:putative membrane protein